MDIDYRLLAFLLTGLLLGLFLIGFCSDGGGMALPY